MSRGDRNILDTLKIVILILFVMIYWENGAPSLQIWNCIWEWEYNPCSRQHYTFFNRLMPCLCVFIRWDIKHRFLFLLLLYLLLELFKRVSLSNLQRNLNFPLVLSALFILWIWEECHTIRKSARIVHLRLRLWWNRDQLCALSNLPPRPCWWRFTFVWPKFV